MKTSRITKYFQILRRLPSSSNLAIFTLVSFLLIPAHPLKEENSHWIEQVGQYSSKEAGELLHIYSLLKSQGSGLKEGWIWDISHTILEESRKHSLDPLLVLAMINVESSFRNTAVSSEGARGLMQIHPVFANALAEEADLESWQGEKSLDDPILNIKLGVFYLHSLKENFRDLKLALTAYNWGPTEVKNRLHEDGMLPFEYAMKVLSTYRSYREDSR